MEYEDRLRISTPEGVDLELTLAGLGSRFLAGTIDFTIQWALIIGAVLLTVGFDALTGDGGLGGIDGDDGAALAVAIVTLFAFLVTFGYHVLFEVRSGGRTPGKRLAGLRVVRDSGRPVGFVTSAIRNILRLVDLLPFAYGLGVATIFASSRNQRLGDMAAGTIVVRERKGGRGAPQGAPTSGFISPVAADTAGWDVSAVTAQEVATVRQYLERRASLTEAARSTIAADLAARLRPKVAGAPEHAAPETFLEGLSAAKAGRAEP